MSNNGLLAEAKVMAYYIEQGYEVFTQFGGKAPFDLVIYKDSKLHRVSVKSTSQKRSDRPYWVLKINQTHYNASGKVRKHFDKESCDILVIYIIPEDRLVFFEAKNIKALNSISIKPLA